MCAGAWRRRACNRCVSSPAATSMSSRSSICWRRAPRSTPLAWEPRWVWARAMWCADEDGAEHPKLKLAAEKTTWPGRKAVYRHPQWEEDVVQLESEPAPPGYQRVLRPVMRQGRIIPGSLPPLSEIWELAQANLRALPEPYHAL